MDRLGCDRMFVAVIEAESLPKRCLNTSSLGERRTPAALASLRPAVLRMQYRPLCLFEPRHERGPHQRPHHRPRKRRRHADRTPRPAHGASDRRQAMRAYAEEANRLNRKRAATPQSRWRQPAVHDKRQGLQLPLYSAAIFSMFIEPGTTSCAISSAIRSAAGASALPRWT